MAEKKKLEQILLDTKKTMLNIVTAGMLQQGVELIRECNYRLSIIDEIKLIVRSSPRTQDMKQIGPHYVAMMKDLGRIHEELVLQPPWNEPQNQNQDFCNDVIQKYLKKFKSYRATDNDQYIKDVIALTSEYIDAFNKMRKVVMPINKIIHDLQTNHQDDNDDNK